SLEETVPLIASLLSLPLPEERYPVLRLSGPQQRQQTQDLLVSWLVAAAIHQPLLAVWEDLHWADPSTLEVLGLLIGQAPSTTMLHVLTYRPEFESPWPRRSHITPITLNRLDRQQVETLIARQAHGKVLPVEVIDHIVTKTDGVPLYVEELTQMLLASEVLVAKVDRYELTGPLVGVTIPDTLQDSLMARLDQLNEAKQIAQLGAVLGRTFLYEMLRTLSAMEEEPLQEGLSQLVEAELLYQRGRPPQATYIFKHALIQDTAYASLLRRRRQQMHQQIAQLIETQFSETVETQPELLAHHYTEAGRTETAMRYWQRAGEHAMQRSAYAEAIANFTQGLTLIPSLPETPERTEHELTLRVALAAPLLATKGYAAPEVGDAYIRARELCQQMDETPQLFPVMHGLWTFQIVRGDLKTADWLADQLLTLAQHLDDRDFLLEAHLALGLTTFFEGAFDRAQPYWDQVWSQYDAQQHHAHISGYLGADPGVLSRIMAAWTLWYQGYPDRALTYAQEAMIQAETLAHPYTLAYAHNYMARLHQCRREFSAAQAEAEASLAICTAHGFNLYVAGGNILHGWAVVAQGQSEAGTAQVRQNLELWRATGAALTVPYYLALLAEACGEDIDAGLAALREGLSTMEKSQERFYEAEFHGLRGDLLRQQVQPDEQRVEACFGQALDVARQQGARSLELRAAIRLARLWRDQGKHKKAYELLDPVYNWFTEGFDTADLQEAKVLLNELEG
ncbi:MAG: adenylate cyclase, partial [Candidatus Tectomicrobia bacterium]|nr:adenylate cyclase [Candidatus Tectomicrobia bacterium]